MADYTFQGVYRDMYAGEPGPQNAWNSDVIEWSRMGAAQPGDGGDRRAIGIFGDYNTILSLHTAVNRGNSQQAVNLLKKLQSSRYGALGTPYESGVPERLDEHIQLQISAPKARLDSVIGEMLEAEGDVYKMQKALHQMYVEGRDMLQQKAPTDARLTEVRPGVFTWTKWKDDPEWTAYKEGRAEQRRSAAQMRAQGGSAYSSMPTMESRGGYAQLQDLYAAHEGGAAGRPGKTEATKPGAVPYGDTPGYIGMQAAAYSAPEPEEYEY